MRPLSAVFPVLLGSLAAVLPDDPAEIIALMEAGIFGDLRDRDQRGPEQVERMTEPVLDQILLGSAVHFSPEHPQQGGPMDLQPVGEFFPQDQFSHFSAPCIKIIFYAPNMSLKKQNARVF